jgi:hypothetical protein
MSHVRSKVLITGALHQSALDLFMSDKRLDVTYQPDCDRKTLLGSLAGVNVLVTRSETDVDKGVVDAAPALKVVARAAVGVGRRGPDRALPAVGLAGGRDARRGARRAGTVHLGRSQVGPLWACLWRLGLGRGR